MENEELHKIAPKLFEIKKENSFQVPDGYFDSFPQRLQEKIHPEKEPTWIQRAVLFLKPHLALATMMVGVFIIAFIGIKLFTPENITTIETGNAQIADVLDYELNDMDEISLMQMLAETQESEVISTEGENDTYIDQAIEYLINEGVSEEMLIQELEIQ